MITLSGSQLGTTCQIGSHIDLFVEVEMIGETCKHPAETAMSLALNRVLDFTL